MFSLLNNCTPPPPGSLYVLIGEAFIKFMWISVTLGFTLHKKKENNKSSKFCLHCVISFPNLLSYSSYPTFCPIPRGVFRNLSRGGGSWHPLGPKTPLKSINFTGPEGAEAP